MVNTLAAHWRHGLALVLLIGTAALGLSYRWQPPPVNNKPAPANTDSVQLPDVRIDQPHLVVFNEKGQNIRTLQGTQLRHYTTTGTSGDRSEVSDPSMQFLQQRDPEAAAVPWQLTAHSALLTDAGEQIALTGDVTLWSDATAGGRTEIRSEALQLDTARQFAETDKTVNIRARRSEATAPGLKADLANERLLLSSGAAPATRVKETHDVRR